MQEIWQQIKQFATNAGIKLVLAIVLLVIGFWLIRHIMRLVSKSKGFNKIDPGARSFIRSFASIALKVLLVISAVTLLGVPMTSVVAILASAGLAIGLALQGALGNLAGGLMILIFKPFRVGDVIDTKDGMGIVLEINIFYTILKTFDNRRITLPNGNLTNAAITNFSVEEKRRVDMKFSTSYEADIDQVIRIILDIVNSRELVDQEPEPFCRLESHGDNALIFVLRFWCDASEYWNNYFDVLETVKKSFDANGISIPFHQLDVHFDHPLPGQSR